MLTIKTKTVQAELFWLYLIKKLIVFPNRTHDLPKLFVWGEKKKIN